jgi:predicted Zn-ribbon and HTH transcriptional regulator
MLREATMTTPIEADGATDEGGFQFDEHKLHKPGKCPRCKGT